MYQKIGDEVLDSVEVAKKIEENTPFRLINDLTGATGREDAIGLRLACKIREIPGFESKAQPDEETVNAAMEALDEFSYMELKKVLYNRYAYMSFAYGYNEVEEDILFVLVLMLREIKEAKLKDVVNRLLKL